jgi:4-carboxymuconolactone decarboxylase
MSADPDALGGRLPLVDPATLAGEQREVFDLLMTTLVPWADGVPFQSRTADGRLIGPFNSALVNPATSSRFLELQFAEQVHTSLSERVRQVVTLTVGAVWRADYELYAHSAVARKAGLSERSILTLVNGGCPEDLSAEEKIAHRVTRQLCTEHRVDEELYREAERTFGTEGLIDLTTLIGVYHGVCITLTMFAVPAPEPILSQVEAY